MHCVMCDELGADCTLHGTPVNAEDALRRFQHVKVENDVLRATVGALQGQLKVSRRLVNENVFRRLFAETLVVATTGGEDLHEAAGDHRIQESAILIPVSMAMRRFESIKNICNTALMDRGQ